MTDNRSYSLRYQYGARPAARVTIPYATIGLIVTCVIAFIMQLSSQGFSDTFAFNPLYTQPWMFVTSVFLHGSFSHIFWNMFILFMFGGILERVIGYRNYIALFILAGIAGNIGYLIFCHATGSFYYSLGASGAIYGVFACLAILNPNMKVYLMFFIPLKIIYVLILFAVVDIVFMSAADNVAHSAHLAGLVVGLLFAWYIKQEVKKIQQVMEMREAQ